MRSRLRCTTSGGGENSTGTMGIFAPALTLKYEDLVTTSGGLFDSTPWLLEFLRDTHIDLSAFTKVLHPKFTQILRKNCPYRRSNHEP